MSLRVLMLSPQFRPLVGGYERAAERLSAALAARGHAVTVIAERREAAWPKREVSDGVAIERLWCLHRPRLHMATALLSFGCFLLTRGRQFDVWHVYHYGTHAVLAGVLSKLLRRPLVLRTTSTGATGIERVAAQLPLAGLSKRVLRGVDATVALSREIEAEVLAFGMPVDRVHVIANGIDTEKFRPRGQRERERLREELGIAASGLVVSVGRLSPEKNPEGLVRAWARALPQLPEGWRLAIVGDGPLQAQVGSLVSELDLTASVLLAGHRSNVGAWLGAADLLAVSSLREGLSNTMLEAMASGLAVVSTNVSGTSELLLETGAGIVVAVGQEGQLAAALARMAASPVLRQEMGALGRQVVEKRYSIGSVTTRHEQLYRRLVDDNSIRSGSN